MNPNQCVRCWDTQHSLYLLNWDIQRFFNTSHVIHITSHFACDEWAVLCKFSQFSAYHVWDEDNCTLVCSQGLLLKHQLICPSEFNKFSSQSASSRIGTCTVYCAGRQTLMLHTDRLLWSRPWILSIDTQVPIYQRQKWAVMGLSLGPQAYRCDSFINEQYRQSLYIQTLYYNGNSSGKV